MVNTYKWFIEELNRFDPDLTLFWNFYIKKWQVCRKVKLAVPHYIDDYVVKEIRTFLAPVLTVDEVDNRIFYQLKKMDLWSKYGKDKIAEKMMKEMEEKRESFLTNKIYNGLEYAKREIVNSTRNRQFFY